MRRDDVSPARWLSDECFGPAEYKMMGGAKQAVSMRAKGAAV
jgi:hypothetical protein